MRRRTLLISFRSLEDKKAKVCPHCSKIYVSMPAFSMHLRTHNQTCRCETCGKLFSRPWLLQGHLRTHTGTVFLCCILTEHVKSTANKVHMHRIRASMNVSVVLLQASVRSRARSAPSRSRTSRTCARTCRRTRAGSPSPAPPAARPSPSSPTSTSTRRPPAEPKSPRPEPRCASHVQNVRQ